MHATPVKAQTDALANITENATTVFSELSPRKKDDFLQEEASAPTWKYAERRTQVSGTSWTGGAVLWAVGGWGGGYLYGCGRPGGGGEMGVVVVVGGGWSPVLLVGQLVGRLTGE